MSDINERLADLSAEKRALLALKKLQAKVSSLERAQKEPIAIVGMSCRFPGGEDPEAYWRLLREGREAVREIPKDRFDVDAYYDPDPDKPGRMYTRRGSFLPEVDRFDARFFGISPREAARMDPQQRLLLEVSWEALERAGEPVEKLLGTRTGVYVGIGVNDYAHLQMDPGATDRIDAYSGTGNGFCFAAGRLSYLLGLQGPSLSLDTACSSSLVAVHLAAMSLRAGECRLALAAGVQLMISPLPYIFLSRTRALAPDGRCKTFDASADGYARGEGCGVVVLKRLSDALADGNSIYAVIRGTAVNHDGASSGFTVPNGLAQKAVIRAALANADVAPAQVGYVEAHGTGTSLGDPIEVEALAEVLGEGRPKDRPLLIGAVKTNVGHLEAGAGVAGLIKTVQMLRYRQVPPTLHLKRLNPLIPWGELPVKVPTTLTPWEGEGPRIAGVSSFGLSGTNAHVVLEEAPVDARRSEASRRPVFLLPLSARSPEALAAQAERYGKYLEANPSESLADVCFTAAVARTQLTERAAVVAGSVEELREKLVALARGEEREGVVRGQVGREKKPGVGLRGAEGVESLREGQGEWKQRLMALGAQWVRGAEVDWVGLEAGVARRRVELPTYPWQRQRHWMDVRQLGPAPSEPVARAVPTTGNEPEFVRQLRQAAPSRRRTLLVDHVRGAISRIMEMEEAQFSDDAQGFFDMGMDSLMAVELRKRLETSLGRTLSTTLAFDHPSIGALVEHLIRDVLQLEGAANQPGRASPSRATPGEPIAIIGMACRFPGGANDPETYWKLLHDGVDATSEVPRERWDVDAYYDADPDAPGKMYTRRGGFLRGVAVDRFDAGFFGISAREATSMDPQQRLLLEVGWEALERAGQPLERLTDSRTAVMVGLASNDYIQVLNNAGGMDRADIYFVTGNSYSVAAGRMSFVLGLQGPCLPVDTACSSSLVATHLACQALREGEADLALAGGVNLMLTPDAHVLFSKARALSPDGRCKTFDASADGYARGEGCGVVVLKRLSDALRAGDEVLAVIRGSAVNHDGRSSGLTVPNGQSQQAVIRQALASAGVEPAKVGYVEAHGTGTPLGDPIELQALGAVLGEGRPADAPVWVGSAKTNIGHLEAAAGVAGLMKVVLALRHREIPPHLHLKTPGPHIPWERLPVKVPTSLMPWGCVGPRIAGLSSFGMSGTNAHLVLEEAPPRAECPAHERAVPAPHLLPLSARSPEALRDLATTWRSFLLDERAGPVADLCFTAATRRTHHAHRTAVVGRTREELAAGLEDFLAVRRPERKAGPRRRVFVFPGQGSQWPGMGRELMVSEPVFRSSIEACEVALRRHVEWSLTEVLEKGDAELLQRVDVVQPTLFAMQVALAALWRSWGVEPDAVIGHSMGEVAAAHVAGALGLEDAARVICERSRLVARSSQSGAMAVVDLPRDEAEALLRGLEGRVAVGASNGPRSTVLSGDREPLAEILSGLEARGVFCRWVKVDYASHSPHMDPLEPELLRLLEGVSPKPASVPIYSTVTAEPCDGANYDAAYWSRNLRAPVLFWPAIERLVAEGHDVFLEVSPHPVLLHPLEQGLAHLGREATTLPSLRSNESERESLLESLGALYASGCDVDHARLHPEGGRFVELPSYPWQRQRYWADPPRRAASTVQPGSNRSRGSTEHSLLGAHITVARSREHLWNVEVEPEALPLLKESEVHGLRLVPASVGFELALSAAASLWKGAMGVLEAGALHEPWVLPEEGRHPTQLVLTPDGEGRFAFELLGARTEEGPWQRHASGRLVRVARGGTSQEVASLTAIRARCREELSAREHEERLRRAGVQLGGLVSLWRRDGEVLGLLRLPEAEVAGAGAFLVHPALLEQGMRLLSMALPGTLEGPLLPERVDAVRVLSRPVDTVWAHAVLRGGNEATVGDVRLLDESGRVLVELEGVRLLPAARGLLRLAVRQRLDGWLYELAWQPKPRSVGVPRVSGRGQWLLLADRGGTAEALAARLEARGERVLCAWAAPEREVRGEGRWAVSPTKREDLEWLLWQVGPEVRGIVHLWSLDAPDLEGATPDTLLKAQESVTGSIPPLAQALTVLRVETPPKLWLVTRGAQPAGEEPGTLAVAQSPLWGIGRVFALEHPDLWGGLVDLAPGTTGLRDVEALAEELLAPDGEDHIALRTLGRRAARVTPRRGEELDAGPVPLREDASYLITGGLGGLGLMLARWLADNGARHLVLTGRKGMPERSTEVEAIQALERRGVSVRVIAADASDAGRMATVFEEAVPPVRGVIHAAGVSRPMMLAQTRREDVEAVLAPKVAGTWNLHLLTRERELDFFVLFSSAAAMWGGAMLGPYAAANHFMDAVARHRRAQGLPAVSIGWGSWEGGSMIAAMPEEARAYLDQIGFGTMASEEALESFGLFLGAGAPVHRAVAVIDWSLFKPVFEARRARPLLELLEVAETPPPPPDEVTSKLLRSVASAGVEERIGLLATHVRTRVADVLGLGDSASLGLEQGFFQLGMDSIMSVRLRKRLEMDLGRALPSTLAFDYPSVRVLAGFLSNAVEKVDPKEVAGSSVVARAPAQGGAEGADETSEDELLAMLASELAALKSEGDDTV